VKKRGGSPPRATLGMTAPCETPLALQRTVFERNLKLLDRTAAEAQAAGLPSAVG